MVARGVIDFDTADLVAADPDFIHLLSTGAEALAGLAIGVVSEWWYSRAKRQGKAT